MKSSLLNIPELVGLDAAAGLVRIPTEQDVPVTPRVKAIIDTAEFRRLATITQLGLVCRVYPGAMHTRFEHALGVFHNALRYLWQLGRDPRFCQSVDTHSAEVLMVAALLHDLGHWPFCHPIEDMMLTDLPPHEHFAAEFLADGGELSAVLRNEWKIEPDEVLDVLVAKTDSPRMRLLRSILSGPIDIDKMDYLERDSLHVGVPYGRNFDKGRLIQSLLVNEAGDGLAISIKGKVAAELMVFARYIMFSEVYWHHTVRSATAMFARAFFDLHRELDLKQLFRKSEAESIQLLRQRAIGLPCAQLLEGIFGPRREIYKRVAEFSLYQSPSLYDQLARKPFVFLVECSERLAEILSRATGETVRGNEIIIDAPPPHREVEFNVQIYFPKESVYRPLSEVSPVVAALARTQFDDYVKRVRLFANRRVTALLAQNHDIETLLQQAIDHSSGK